MKSIRAVELANRLRNFAVRVIRLVRALPRSGSREDRQVRRHIGGQLLRCSTSPGANYEEACGAESRADFAHKVGVAVKELKETRYWLGLVAHVPLVHQAEHLGPLLQENEELIAILSKSYRTARARQ